MKQFLSTFLGSAFGLIAGALVYNEIDKKRDKS